MRWANFCSKFGVILLVLLQFFDMFEIVFEMVHVLCTRTNVPIWILQCEININHHFLRLVKLFRLRRRIFRSERFFARFFSVTNPILISESEFCNTFAMRTHPKSKLTFFKIDWFEIEQKVDARKIHLIYCLTIRLNGED